MRAAHSDLESLKRTCQSSSIKSEVEALDSVLRYPLFEQDQHWITVVALVDKQ